MCLVNKMRQKNIMNIILIYNNKAGAGNFFKKLKYIEKLFGEKGIPFKSINIRDLNNDISFENFDTIVAIGGDGTVLSVLPYIVNKNIRLGIIPCGTANLLAEKLNIPGNIKQAVDLIINGSQKLIDVGKIGGSYFVLRVGYGIDADIVNGTSPFLKNRLGYLAYLIQGLKCIFNLEPKTFEIETDNKAYKVNASAVIVSNSANMFRNRFAVAPLSDISDGKLDIFVLMAKNIWEFLAVFGQIIFNRHKPCPNVLYAKSDTISIKSYNEKFHIDGEARQSQNVDISLIHNGLAVIAP